MGGETDGSGKAHGRHGGAEKRDGATAFFFSLSPPSLSLSLSLSLPPSIPLSLSLTLSYLHLGLRTHRYIAD